MPELARFYGIRVFVCFGDHPPPHFHVEYGEYEAVFGIHTLALLQGSLPARARGLVVDWASRHADELLAAWQAAAAGQSPNKIAPLD